jgi:hypothetical protein
MNLHLEGIKFTKYKSHILRSLEAVLPNSAFCLQKSLMICSLMTIDLQAN